MKKKNRVAGRKKRDCPFCGKIAFFKRIESVSFLCYSSFPVPQQKDIKAFICGSCKKKSWIPADLTVPSERESIMKYEIRYEELKEYLNSLTYRDFCNKESENYIQKAYTTKELELSKNKDSFKDEKFIDYGMPYLVDVLGNDVSVVWHTKKKHKLKTCSGVRSLNLKFDRTLIDDCRTVLGSCVNGYWAIPKQFIVESK